MGGHETTHDKLDEGAKRDQELHAEVKELRAEVKGWRTLVQGAATSPPMLKGNFGLQDLGAAAESTGTADFLRRELRETLGFEENLLSEMFKAELPRCDKCGSTNVTRSHQQASESADTFDYTCENGHYFRWPPKGHF